jgi:hypothetical protein
MTRDASRAPNVDNVTRGHAASNPVIVR